METRLSMASAKALGFSVYIGIGSPTYFPTPPLVLRQKDPIDLPLVTTFVLGEKSDVIYYNFYVI